MDDSLATWNETQCMLAPGQSNQVLNIRNCNSLKTVPLVRILTNNEDPTKKHAAAGVAASAAATGKAGIKFAKSEHVDNYKCCW